MATIGLDLDPDKPIGECSVAECQQVEIARAVYENAKILILDEPTSSLTDREIDSLLECIDGLRKKGVAVVMITHKIEEIMRVADRVVVLLKGNYVGELMTKDTNPQELTNMMVGRPTTLNIDRSEPTNLRKCLEVKNLSVSYKLLFCT